MIGNDTAVKQGKLFQIKCSNNETRYLICINEKDFIADTEFICWTGFQIFYNDKGDERENRMVISIVVGVVFHVVLVVGAYYFVFGRILVNSRVE